MLSTRLYNNLHDFHYYFFYFYYWDAERGGATLVEPLSAREIARHCRIELRAATESFRNLFLTYWERREMKTDDDDGAEVCFGSGCGWGQWQIAVAALLWLLLLLLPLLSLPLDGEHARALVTLCPEGRTLARSLRRVARCTVGRGGDAFQLFTVFCFGFFASAACEQRLQINLALECALPVLLTKTRQQQQHGSTPAAAAPVTTAANHDR